jgi:hypothetical protein
MTALRRITLALCVILAALTAASGATAASGSAVRNCGNSGFNVNVTTRNLASYTTCRDVKRWLIPEFMRGARDLSVPQVWWRRIGNHVPQLWKCRSYLNDEGRTDVRCTYRTTVVHWQIVWDD